MLPIPEIFIRNDRVLHRVADFAEASAMYCAARDSMGEGASKTPDGTITDANGKIVARISYNGKVWPPEEWHAAMRPLFNPYR